MDSSSLAAILKRKRPLPLKKAKIIAQRLGLSPEEARLFYNSAFFSRAGQGRFAEPEPRDDTHHLTEEQHFRIIAEWEYYAVLNLMQTRGFRSDGGWIARRLAITELRAKEVIERLLEAGLVKADASGRFVRTSRRLHTSEDVVSVSLRKSHKESLETGIRKLEEIDVEFRDFSSMTMPVSLEKLKDAKTLIRSFQKRLAALLREEPASEVYEVCVQLFPLTVLPAQTKKGSTHAT